MTLAGRSSPPAAAVAVPAEATGSSQPATIIDALAASAANNPAGSATDDNWDDLDILPAAAFGGSSGPCVRRQRCRHGRGWPGRAVQHHEWIDDVPLRGQRGPDSNLPFSITADVGEFDFHSAVLDFDVEYFDVEGGDGSPRPVPEPATLALVGIGLTGLAFTRRRE